MRKRELRKRRDNFFSSLFGNEIVYDYYYDTIKEMAISRFEWHELPEEIDARFLELMLFERGAVSFFYDDILQQYIVQPFTQKAGFTIYRQPVRLEAYAVNGAHWDLDKDNSVIIYNNVLRTNTVRDAELYAYRLTNIDRTIDINIHAQKTPVLIRCDEKERLSLQNLYMKYDGNQPVIYGDKRLSAEPLEVLQTNAPFIAPDLYELKVKIWNEMLTKLGISNVNYQKKERMITDEVLRGQGGTVANRYSGLMMRQQAADQINDMFELNISVVYREDETDLDTSEPENDMIIEEREVIDNE